MPKQKSMADFATKSNSMPRSTENSNTQPLRTEGEVVIQGESSDVNYEKLLNLESDDYGELKLSEPPSTFASSLHPYQKQALTWMLAREGLNENLYSKMNSNIRQLHPLWEEYLLRDGTHIYFNPYTGQVSVELPKAAPDCLGGILADEMGLGKTVMMISLMHSHPYPRNDDTIFKKSLEKKRKMNPNTPGLKKAGTLIVVPVTLLAQWESEFEAHSHPKTIRIFVYYGDRRSQGKGDLGRYDVVLTTYGIISNEFTSTGQKELFKYQWFRVVLDEAHYIKGRTIQTAKAVYDLNAIHKWCLSGTPIQNKLDDLFSLIHFLKLEPWSDYVWWNTYINKPNEKSDKVVFQILQSILRPILLRRTKKT
jgi:DNA repair protein RAD5